MFEQQRQCHHLLASVSPAAMKRDGRTSSKGPPPAPRPCPTAHRQHICPDVLCPLCWVCLIHPRPGHCTDLNSSHGEEMGRPGGLRGELGSPGTVLVS